MILFNGHENLYTILGLVRLRELIYLLNGISVPYGPFSIQQDHMLQQYSKQYSYKYVR